MVFSTKICNFFSFLNSSKTTSTQKKMCFVQTFIVNNRKRLFSFFLSSFLCCCSNHKKSIFTHADCFVGEKRIHQIKASMGSLPFFFFQHLALAWICFFSSFSYQDNFNEVIINMLMWCAIVTNIIFFLFHLEIARDLIPTDICSGSLSLYFFVYIYEHTIVFADSHSDFHSK